MTTVAGQQVLDFELGYTSGCGLRAGRKRLDIERERELERDTVRGSGTERGVESGSSSDEMLRLKMHEPPGFCCLLLHLRGPLLNRTVASREDIPVCCSLQ